MIRSIFIIAIAIWASFPFCAFALTNEQPSQSQGYALYNPDIKFNPDKNETPDDQGARYFKIGGMNFYLSGSGGYGPAENTRPPTVQNGGQIFSPMTDWQTRNFPH